MNSRTVRARTCKCGAAVLVGLDADWLAIQTTLDAHPLDNVGELLAVLQGRRTYDLRRTSSRGSHGREMDERNAWRIANPWAMPWPVHTEHRCGQPLPAAAAKPPTVRNPTDDVILEGAPF